MSDVTLALFGPITEAVLLSYLRSEVKRAGTQKALAAEYGVSGQFLGDVLCGRRAPSGKLLGGLGLRRVVMYERLPDADDGANANVPPLALPEGFHEWLKENSDVAAWDIDAQLDLFQRDMEPG